MREQSAAEHDQKKKELAARKQVRACLARASAHARARAAVAVWMLVDALPFPCSGPAPALEAGEQAGGGRQEAGAPPQLGAVGVAAPARTARGPRPALLPRPPNQALARKVASSGSALTE